MIQIETSLCILAAIGGFIYSLKYNNKLNVIISTILILSFIFSIITLGLQFCGFLSFILASILCFAYPFVIKNLDKTYRISIAVFALPFIISPIANILHLPFANELALLQLIPIGIGIYTYILLNKRKYKYEIGFLGVFTICAFFEIFNLALSLFSF